jgi:uncharacterized OB-fold protein
VAVENGSDKRSSRQCGGRLMPTCPNCGTLHYYLYCLTCEARREELLERLREDDEVATFSEVSSWALHGTQAKLEQCWRIG